MSTVTVDGEGVKFGGDIPLDPSQVYGLLMDALSEQSRVVVGFAVDGKDALQDDQFPSSYEKIEAIPPIPVDAIQQFLKWPLIFERDEMEDWPYVVSSYEAR